EAVPAEVPKAAPDEIESPEHKGAFVEEERTDHADDAVKPATEAPAPSSPEIETIQLPSMDQDEPPALDFPRLSPRTFDVVDGQPTGAAVGNRAHRSAQMSAEKLAERYW